MGRTGFLSHPVAVSAKDQSASSSSKSLIIQKTFFPIILLARNFAWERKGLVDELAHAGRQMMVG